MASSHRPGGRSPRARRARPARSAASSAPPLVVIGSLVLGAGVLVLVFAISSGTGEAQATTPPRSDPTAPAATRAPDPDAIAATARRGSPPNRPSPVIPDAFWTAADERYRKAAELWNEAQTERRAGRTAEYQAALLASWDEFEKLGKAIEPYTDWLEEADFEGWAMPAEYSRLQGRLEVWDPLRAKVRKLKPISPR